MKSAIFERLRRFLTTEMRMSHVYQPVMLQALISGGGKASVRQVAKALLSEDRAQTEYYENIARQMPGRVLQRHGVVEFDKATYSLSGFDDLTQVERGELNTLCQFKIEAYLAKRADPWAHRRKSAGYVSGTLRYEILKRAAFRCELCGTSAESRALEVDHIIPRNHGGTDDLSNLQALCYVCNAMKRDRDDTDFRDAPARYRERQPGCVFCDIAPARIVEENELFVAIRDAYPVTDGHSLLIPRRHVASPRALLQPELNAMWSLASTISAALLANDPKIEGFNQGSNDGVSAGQTVMHAHFHLIPRRGGDVEEPRGGVRGVIPAKQAYQPRYDLGP